LGLGGDMSIPINTIVTKEIDLRGSLRFHEEFADAVEALNTGSIDVARLLTARYPVSDSRAAFDHAGDRNRAMKVQLDFLA